jgi:cell division protein FtsB
MSFMSFMSLLSISPLGSIHFTAKRVTICRRFFTQSGIKSWNRLPIPLSVVMPPENTDPVAKTQPAELDFEAPAVENPRIKRRSLKGRATTTTPTQASSMSPEPTRAAVTPDQPRSSLQTLSPATGNAPSHTGYTRPGTTPAAEKPQQPTPSGVLYYTNGPQKDAAPKASSATTPAAHPASASHQPTSQRPATTPMQTSPTSRPASTPQPNPTRPVGSSTAGTASSHATQQTPTSRPAASTPPGTGAARAVSTTVAGPSPSSSRPGGVSDYRANIDRQSREQKSIGGILNLIVYALIAIFVLGAGLAAYGAHVIFKQLNAQSMTVSELDSRYSTANQELNAQLKTTAQAVLQLQEQVNRDQELALKQQDAITKLQSDLSSDTESLRQERAARATETSIRISETSALRARLRALESRDQSNYHP